MEKNKINYKIIKQMYNIYYKIIVYINFITHMVSVRYGLYNSGNLFLPRGLQKFLMFYWVGNPSSTFYITNWSLVHLFSGILFGFLVNKYLIINGSYKPANNYYFKMLMLHTTWEIWQIFIENSNPFTLSGHGNFVDIVVDTILFMFGAFIYKEYISN